MNFFKLSESKKTTKQHQIVSSGLKLKRLEFLLEISSNSEVVSELFGRAGRQNYFGKIEVFIWRPSGCPLPLFLVAFAPQSHKKGFPLPSFSQRLRHLSNNLLSRENLGQDFQRFRLSKSFDMCRIILK